MMMKSRSPWETLLLVAGWTIMIGLLLPAAYGCKPGKPSTSPSAAHFKKEVREAFAKLSPMLVDPVSKGEKTEVLLRIGKMCDESVRMGYPLECHISVLDGKGIMMVSRPAGVADRMNYSHYEAVREACKKKRMIHRVNYLQNGSRLYSIATPLLKKGKVVGLLSLSYDSLEMQRKYGLTDQDFLALDFNS